MDVLISRRRGLKSRITQVQTKIGKYPDPSQPMPIFTAQVEMGKLGQLQLECDQLHRDLSAIPTVNDDDFEQFAAEIEAMNNRIQDLNLNLVQFIPPPTMVSSTTSSGAAFGSHSSSQVRLPKLDLPTFDGDQLAWTSFHDLFSACVHTNKSLTGAQKLQYLKTVLKGVPSQLIQSITISDANYDEAWTILKDRYANEKLLVFAHLKTLVHHPAMLGESADDFRNLYDTIIEHSRAMEVLRPGADHWDSMLVYLTTEKLDTESLRQWAQTHASTSVPTFKDLTDFMKARREILEQLAAQNQNSIKPTKDSKKSNTSQDKTSSKTVTKSFLSSTTPPPCILCNDSHLVAHCPKYKEVSQEEKRKLVKDNNLCLNCLRSGHIAKNCKSTGCRRCQKNHHTTLHYEELTPRSSSPAPEVSTLHSSEPQSGIQVLLSTALVKVLGSNGSQHIYRALLDSASEASFISEKCAQQLGLKRNRINVKISGLSQSGVGTSHSSTKIQISGIVKSFATTLEVMILPKVTGMIPRCKIDSSSWGHIEGLRLADPKCHEPNTVDILLGADIYYDLMLERKIEGPRGSPIAFDTKIGWVLGGKIRGSSNCQFINVHHALFDLDSTLKRFWELEELPQTSQLTPREKSCEDHFSSTHQRNPDGRFVVQLPFIENSPSLGQSRDIAVRRFHQLERRLKSQPQHREEYVKFMSEYESLGHMKILPNPQLDLEISPTSTMDKYYIPHHFVQKESSTTTKFRVVFDASAKTTSGISLNDKLMVGPKLQEDLIPILIRFRSHPIAITADIAKMYRQILVDPRHTDFQRIVWRSSPDLPLKDYRLLTVTYGTASAPYTAVRCLRQLIVDEGSEFPLASEVAKRDLYVDDLMTGVSSQEAGLQLQNEMIQLHNRGCFSLRKFSSNCPGLLESLPEELRETQLPLRIDVDDSIKTLGIRWNPATDNFSFVVNPPPQRLQVTKRSLLSDLAKVFDPLGWLSPTTIKAKIMFQQLWCLPLTWDDRLPDELANEWTHYCSELCLIQQLEIPRFISSSLATSHQLHGFCDASEKAYAAVAYVRSTLNSGEIATTMIAAKTKVSPIKQVSLPRLELCGALLLTKLIRLLLNSLTMEFTEVHAWSDSTIVLAWLADHPNRWKTFVANRVSQIQDVISPSNWHHVKSEENPADCASRGISPSALNEHSLCWHGPGWLSDSEIQFPTTELDYSTASSEEKKNPFVAHITTDLTLVQRFSSLTTLIRVTSYVLRFIRHCRLPGMCRPSSAILDTLELNNSLHYWVQTIQRTEFNDEIKCLKRNKPLYHKSKLLSLTPFIDENGLVRVGGRLHNSAIPEHSKHQILLPRKGPLTDLILKYFHITHLHAGPQLLLSSIRQKYWILCGRDTVRQFVSRCITCHHNKPQLSTQLMGNLPLSRVTQNLAFVHCGVDYAGPIVMRVLKGRGQKTFKGYIAVFVCLATKAIHLELASDLTSQSFIAALKRFISRRGKCSEINSDNGTNFVGANRELKEALKFLKSRDHNQEVSRFLSDEGISWNFIPPSAPHFGGIWESGVKSVKHHLRRVIGDTPLNFEDMTTLLTQIEACLNSRPITPLSSDPDDFSALTPGHFLIGRPLTAIPDPDYSEIPTNRLNHWQQIQRILQHFWKRWSTEYLSSLQQRSKWLSSKPNLTVGTLVLVKEDGLPPSKWHIGRIVQLHPGMDSHVRVVTVKSASGQFKRPITKLSPLPIDQ